MVGAATSAARGDLGLTVAGREGAVGDLRVVNDLGRHLAPVRESLSTTIEGVLSSAWFVLGEQVKRFEHDFAAYCGVSGCVAVASGTDALEISLRAVGVVAGDEVLTVANAGMYGSAAVLAIGATPRYVDIDPSDLLLDVGALKAALEGPGRLPSAIIVTHLYGQAVDMASVMSVAASHGVPVVEDCAQAHGAVCGGRRCGSWGDAAAFSFYPTKNLGALGDAGAVVTDSPQVAGTVRELRQYGWSGKYIATRPGGRNSRMDEIQAAVLNALLPLLDGWNERRRAIARRYSEGIQHVNVTVPSRGGTTDVGHLFVVRAHDRGGLRHHLTGRGIGTEIHYPVPDHLQEAVRAAGGSTDSLPATEAACREVLTLPCFPEMTDAEVDHVIDVVGAW